MAQRAAQTDPHPDTPLLHPSTLPTRPHPPRQQTHESTLAQLHSPSHISPLTLHIPTIPGRRSSRDAVVEEGYASGSGVGDRVRSGGDDYCNFDETGLSIEWEEGDGSGSEYEFDGEDKWEVDIDLPAHSTNTIAPVERESEDVILRSTWALRNALNWETIQVEDIQDTPDASSPDPDLSSPFAHNHAEEQDPSNAVPRHSVLPSRSNIPSSLLTLGFQSRNRRLRSRKARWENLPEGPDPGPVSDIDTDMSLGETSSSDERRFQAAVASYLVIADEVYMEYFGDVHPRHPRAGCGDGILGRSERGSMRV